MKELVFVEDYTFEWPVEVTYPGQDGDEAQTFTAHFRLVPEEEFLGQQDSASFEEGLAADRARVAGVLVGWDGILTAANKPFRYSEKNRDKLLRVRPIRDAVARAYYKAAILGGQRSKNSEPSRG